MLEELFSERGNKCFHHFVLLVRVEARIARGNLMKLNLNRIQTSLLAVLLLPAFATAAAGYGRIVVAFDDWTLANIGFTASPPCQPGTFATNVAAWFTGGRVGRFLDYSSHQGLTGSDLANTMAHAGHAWVVATPMTNDPVFTVTNLLTYDGVFVGGDELDQNVLTQYVQAGGNVYVFSGGITVNSWWNTFLGNFGLEFSGSTSGSTVYPIVSSHPLFQGVTNLYGLNGNSDGATVVDLDMSDPRNMVVATNGAVGLFAIWDGNAPRFTRIQSPKLTGSNFTGSFGTVLYQSYTIQQSTNLTTANWIYYANLTGNGSVYQFQAPLGSSPQQFFRVRQP